MEPATVSRKQHLKLQHRLFFGYLLLSGILLFIFASLFYSYVSAILIQNEMNSLKAVNESFQTQVDSVIQDLDTTSANINFSNLMKDKLDSSFNLNISDSTLRSVVDLFVTINGTDSRADQINLFDFNGNVIRTGILTGTYSVDLKDLTWMDETRSLDGIKLISDPYYTTAYSKTIKSPEWFLSLYRTFSNQYGRKIGAIETIKRCKTVFKSIYSYSKKTTDPASVYVYDKEGNLVYPYSIDDTAKKDALYYFGAIKTLKDSTVVHPSAGVNEHVAYTVSAYSGWTFVSVQTESVILAPVNHLLQVIIVVVLLLLCFSVFVSYYLSRTMIQPIKHLKHRIQRLEVDTLGEEDKKKYDPAYEELAELYGAFEHMSSKLKISMHELIDSRQQEERSRSMALQSQTNPHFYYNTLSSIMILAENGQNEDICLLCNNLSKIMRYISDSSSTLVTIQEELNYVERYLYCMKIRYQDSLTYEIDADPDLLERKIPRLLIQPIVENALKYGTDCIPPWHIQIRGIRHKDYWVLEITDSGNGFEQSTLQNIREVCNRIDQNTGMPELTVDGLGIANVYSRWKLVAKERTIFEVSNTKDGHGKVSIGLKLEIN